MTHDLTGFVDVQEAIPAASSTAKPQAEEAVSQGVASEALAQECLCDENRWENIGKLNTKRIRKRQPTYDDCIWTDGMTVMKQSLMFVAIIEALRNVCRWNNCDKRTKF